VIVRASLKAARHAARKIVTPNKVAPARASAAAPAKPAAAAKAATKAPAAPKK
jgi:hypothetical protein